MEPFILIGSTQANACVGDGDYCSTLTEAMGKGGGQIPMVGEIINPLKGISGYGWHFEQQVYDAEGVTRALKAGGGSGNIPKVIESINAMPDGTCRTIKNQYYKTSVANFERNSTFGATGVCVYGKQIEVDEPVALDEQNEYVRKDGCVGTIMTDGSSSKHNNRVLLTDFRIRKLTPKECFRLMGFDDADVDLLIENGISNTQLYKMAGNSIVVNMLEFLFCQIFDNNDEIWV